MGCGNEASIRGNGTNVLLISLDSTRQDLLGVYGREPQWAPELSPSPNLDALAAEGVLFEDAYATTSWTLPSHMSLFTGAPEMVHGVETDGRALGNELLTLAERLTDAGYRSAGVYSAPYLDPRYGFGRGFETYRAAYGPELERSTRALDALDERLGEGGQSRGALASGLEERGALQRAIEIASHRDRSSETVTRAALAELERLGSGQEPFFLFVHYFDPHYDYDPPAPWNTRFDPDYSGDLDPEDFIRNPSIATFDTSSESGRRRVVDERDLQHVRALYEGELAWTDDQLGRILERLAELGLEQDTLVIVTSDHGDEFFEHTGLGHRRTLFEEVVRVPLLMRLKDVLPEATRVRGPVALTDVVPTVLDLLGLSVPEELSGSSLASIALAGRAAQAVFGRLVRTDGLRINVPIDDGGRVVPVEGLLVTVVETFRQGAIKITRERSWTRAREAVSPSIDAAIRRQSQELFNDERLRWIDVERHPAERAEDHSDDFDDPAALLALTEFRAQYAELARARRATRPTSPEPSVAAALRGLGYAGEEADPDLLAGEELLLPPPGQALFE